MTQTTPVASGTLTANSPSLSLQSWLFFLSPSPKRLDFRNTPGTLRLISHWENPFMFSCLFRFSLIVLLCSALSVMGTWYVTIVVIIKYIWPDKEVTPGYVPTRWVRHSLDLCPSTLSHTNLVALLNHCLLQCRLLDSGFQCDAHHMLWFPGNLLIWFNLRSYNYTFLNIGLWYWRILVVFCSSCWPLSAVPCQLCAGVQQHEHEGSQTVGTCGHTQHDNLPLCLHRDRYCVGWLLKTMCTH